jgi:hypothetical protein
MTMNNLTYQDYQKAADWCANEAPGFLAEGSPIRYIKGSCAVIDHGSGTYRYSPSWKYTMEFSSEATCNLYNNSTPIVNKGYTCGQLENGKWTV